MSCFPIRVKGRLLRPLILLTLMLGVGAGCRSPKAVAPGSEKSGSPKPDDVHLRVNLLGYLPDDSKVAVVFSHAPVDEPVQVLDAVNDSVVLETSLTPSKSAGWGTFAFYYEADFSSVYQEGRYRLRVAESSSPTFGISLSTYTGVADELLGFMRQQRCGYNPFLDLTCHQKDGMSFYGPMPDSTYVDASGGWHDAGDQLKYLITGSNATARMLLAFDLTPQAFSDRADAMGRSGANGIPDVLDEARWGMEWLTRLHPGSHQLIHQVADDRDHYGWKMPDDDNSDYGWGPNSYRPAYFATGAPQGLREFKSEATGIANLAGRYAAAMAGGSRLLAEIDSSFARRSLQAAREVYQMGKAQEGYQQGNSYGAPYRYTERTWADDMEWGAAVLYGATGEQEFLDDAKRYARLANTTSWMQRDSTEHYEFYPFVNVGHFALHPYVDDAFRDTLASFYRDGIERTLRRAQTNPFEIGVPFIWCSNNLVSALITQILLYERMTGDLTYHDYMLRQRDWLLGRNPWGTSMFTGIPSDGEYPLDVHTSVWALTKREVAGGLVDGPVLYSIYSSLKGIHLSSPDEFADFQNAYVVYHDDIGDYATNEPTMDGTAGAVFWMAAFEMQSPK